MSSIADLFELGNDDAPFDPTALNGALDAIISGHRSRMGAEDPQIPTGDAEPFGSPALEDSAEVPATPVDEPEVPEAAEIPAPVADPLAALDAERRNELEIIARSLQDPERADAIRRAYLGVQAPAAEVPAPAPAVAPEPQLPDHITPESVEAELWTQNQTLLRRIDAIEQQSVQSQQATVLDRARAAANTASQRFISRYGSVLSRDEIEAVHKVAGNRRLPDAMIGARGGPETPGAIEEGMYEALEFVLRSTDTLLTRVLSGQAPVGAAPAVSGPPGAAPPAPPVTNSSETKRLLTALSTGANPVGQAPVRQAVQVDHAGGGRMTEVSRRQVVDQAVAELRGQELT